MERQRETLPPPLLLPPPQSQTSNFNPEPNRNFFSFSSSPTPNSYSPPISIAGANEDSALLNAAFLSPEEVLRRRYRCLKQLKKFYSNQYWPLMDGIRVKHRDYYWKFGKSPFKEEERGAQENGLGLGFGEDGERRRCRFSGCKSSSMPLTRYCHLHILSDSKQTLYKACYYVTKSAQSGKIICGKPVLSAAVPSLCSVHFQRIQKHISQALRKAGLNASSSSSLPAAKFHELIDEYVRQIRDRKRSSIKCNHQCR